ncbi:hypothetical protein [Cupriavidus necator]|uniref:hypothetical protein n=1 Tax=Cupriavidus necator TaxID=106590 RepID=UPI003F4FC6C8
MQIALHCVRDLPARFAKQKQLLRGENFPLLGVQPYRARSLKLSSDPYFVEEVRDIVACISANLQTHWLVRERYRRQAPANPAPLAESGVSVSVVVVLKLESKIFARAGRHQIGARRK